MAKVTIEQLETHIKTHTEQENDDRSAVTVLKSFLRSNGRINSKFSEGDKWPNTDGTFELVPDTSDSRTPKRNFVVQIKGTAIAHVTAEGTVKYQLKSLAFPAYIAAEVTLDPGILFLVVNPNARDQERVFWKYISPKFIASIDFGKESTTVEFTAEDEIKNTNESVNDFVKKLEYIANTHSYIKQLESREYTKEDILKLVTARCKNISESIKSGIGLNYTRDGISRHVFTELEDLCKGTLMLNCLLYYSSTNLRLAYQTALINIETKFLSTFLQGLQYIGLRVPEEGQYERLMLKYYGFLWKIRKYLKENYGLFVLSNLEDFRSLRNSEDEEYNKLLAASIECAADTDNPLNYTRYYIQKKVPFYVGTERYFEITLQLADKYATKYNRITVYSKIDISTNYSIQIGYIESEIILWDIPSQIKVVTNWKVSIEPASLNKLSQIIRKGARISYNHSEYAALMDFLTRSGISLLDFIDFQDESFNNLVAEIYEGANTCYFKDVLMTLHNKFAKNSNTLGKRTVRYALIKLREDLLEDILPEDCDEALEYSSVYLSKKCYPFEKNPILYNLPRKKTNGKTISKDVLRSMGTKNTAKYLPYIRIKHLIDSTGEIYHHKDEVEYEEGGQTIQEYNSVLSEWDGQCGQRLKEEDEYVYLDEYVQNTVFILRKLLDYSSAGNDGQQHLNQKFISSIKNDTIDDIKRSALKNAFVSSRLIMIYGAAGTGKTTLMDYISKLMNGRSKLFLTQTHTALENLQRIITSQGARREFQVVDQFINSTADSDFDIIFVDECSTVDNRTMCQLLSKISKDSLLVLAGDTYQIESIDFGNWFFHAKEILPEKAIIELNGTWRTKKQAIKDLWDEVRFINPLITEKLVIDGPFSENIGKNIFEKTDDDEVVLCLNYDGKFGLNNINGYFQDANPSTNAVRWLEWKYKAGDPVLFNESTRFPMLYNNLKGTIADIQSGDGYISFTIDIPIVLTALDIRNSDLEIVSNSEESTRIRFSVYAHNAGKEKDYETARIKAIVPFQLAYAVSIHKAQGLEYNSIKVVIPHSNSERISHGIFYTAITRAKEKLKIFWSADTMEQVISGFNNERDNRRSLELIKNILLGR